MAPHFALLTGVVAGVLVVFSVLFFDQRRIDDPVGAVSVHGVCGAWGTLAIGLFKMDAGLLVGGGATQFLVQVVGVLAGFLVGIPGQPLMFYAIKATIGLRVSEEEEMEGLDIHEHGMHAYPIAMIAEGATGFPLHRQVAGAMSGVSQPVASPEGV
jgi:ammonium transporter, Amt family